MRFAGILAGTFMAAGCALLAADTPVARRATYTFYRWRRRHRTWRWRFRDRQTRLVPFAQWR